MPPPCRDDDDIEASIDEVTLEAFPAVVHGEARKMRDRGAATATTTQTCCPVCLVNYSDGDMLWAIFVLPPRRPVDPGRCLASSASTSYGVGVLIVSTVALASFFCSRMSMPLAAAGPLSMPPPCRDDDDIEASIDEVTLEAFPAVVHGEARKMRDRGAATATTTQTCCPVCLVNYSDGDMLWVLLDCGHLFHRECVNPWLRPHADAACRGDAGRYGQAVVRIRTKQANFTADEDLIVRHTSLSATGFYDIFHLMLTSFIVVFVIGDLIFT
ncbi:hypothetical protein E2562_034979 [Oryza meyeriana var. granulata]|uniref:RING-type domain-containing protein n=1 Tax=Oryza meyeriana var. granulata TaxID=110450 RepID=A0A6G1FFC6_9ORYZ|nr:hypothetical protein E2562_034979 [Oryza meyeriana var. granulata]